MNIMEALEKKTGKGFGDPQKPLLVSVRSGSALSMPGMMDTILNLGLNDETAEGMIALTKNERFVNDAYRRFLQLFGKIGLGVPDAEFDKIFDEVKEKYSAHVDTELSAEALAEVVQKFKDVIKQRDRQTFPPGPLGPALLRHGGRLQVLDGQAGGGLPPPVQHHPGSGLWHRGEHLHHGLRQHGQRLRPPAWASPGTRAPAKISSTATI